MFRINTNVPSLAAQRTLNNVTTEKANTYAKLTSGNRINRSSDDAAGLAISEKMKGQMRSTAQANRNANDAISMVQTAEGSLSEISSVLVRLRELSIQSASDTVGDTEREFTNLEYQNLKQEIQRIASVTEFNGKKMLNGTEGDFEFQIGINNNADEDRLMFRAETSDASLDNLGIEALTISQKVDAQDSLEKLDQAMQWVSGQRANLGAIQNRLISTSNNLAVNLENISTANSRIRDTDYAQETSNNVRLSILAQAGTSVLSQANVESQMALKLLS
jgi:flagellin